MAKNSAKSKGYRKHVEKKPYLSKRDIVVMCVLAAAIAVAAFFLFRYDDGALKLQDGSVVTDGDNWLIVNGSNTRGGRRYYKLGEIGEVDGYNRTTQSLATDDNIPEYLFSPAVEGNQVGSITVTTSHNGAQALAKYARTALESIEGNEMGELQTAALDGRDVAYYIYSSEREQGDVTNNASGAVANDASGAVANNAAADTQAVKADDTASTSDDGGGLVANSYSKSLVGYTDAARDSCIVVHVNSNAADAETAMSDDALIVELGKILAAVTLEEGK